MTNQFVKTGTISVSAGSTVVTGVNTSFDISKVAKGLLVTGGVSAFIDTVESNTALTLVSAWPGPDVVSQSYVIQRERAEASSTIIANDRLAQVVANLEAGTFFDLDAVGPLVDRATYDDAAAGFTYGVPAAVEGGNPTIYFKLTATSADWSVGQSMAGPPGAGSDGDAATIAVGNVTTLLPGTPATFTNSGTSTAAVIDVGLPAGDKGDTGSSATVGVGTVTTLAPGETATVSNSGDANHAVFEFGIPAGDDGTAATVTIGTITTGAPGSNVVVTNSGTSAAAILDFTIPAGDKGDTGTAATLSAGTATALAAGATPTVTNSGDANNAVFNLGIPAGNDGVAATLSVGAVTTGAPGSNVSITNNGTPTAAVLDIQIPSGEKGDEGTAATIAAGTVTSLAAGASATVVNSGDANSAIFDFGVPVGNTGDAATISIGTVTTGAAGTDVIVTNSGTAGAAVLDIQIPRGEQGLAGAGTGDMLAANYDPNVKSTDAFSMGNMDETATAKIFNDLERSKLTAIEANATADQTGGEIKAAYEAEANTNNYSDAEKAKVGYITISQLVDLDALETRVNELDAAVVLQGLWDASTGTFPGGGTAQAGHSFIVDVGGTVDGVEFVKNDRLIALADNASVGTYATNWHKLDYSDAVLSVAGLTGAINAAALKVALGIDQVDNVPDANKPVSTPQQAAIDAAIANLIDSSPGALDTLSKLAAAIGDDPNFAATMTTSLAGKASLNHTHAAGDIISGTFAIARLPVATSGEIRSKTADRLLGSVEVFGAMVEVPLQDGANIALDLAAGFDFTVTLGGDRQLDNPTHVTVGQRGRIRFQQDGTGGRLLTYGTYYKFAGGTAPVLSTDAGVQDIVYYDCVKPTEIVLYAALGIA